jgi:hypothetical protein
MSNFMKRNLFLSLPLIIPSVSQRWCAFTTLTGTITATATLGKVKGGPSGKE